MRALSIRQPYAELILRGVKTIEFRSRPTHIIGQRFYIYASKGKSRIGGDVIHSSEHRFTLSRSTFGNVKSSQPPKLVRADNLVAASPPIWMVELANALKLFPKDLPTGVIVGSAVIDKVTPPDETDGHGYDGLFRWHLKDVQRAKHLTKPKGHPQPVWWRPE